MLSPHSPRAPESSGLHTPGRAPLPALPHLQRGPLRASMSNGPSGSKILISCDSKPEGAACC